MTRVQNRRISSGECRLTTRARPSSSVSPVSRRSISSAMAGSRDATGSSASTTRGDCTISRAMAARCCSPPDRWDVRSHALSPMPMRSRALSAIPRSWGHTSDAADRSRPHCPSRPASTLCSTGRWGTRSYCWWMIPTRVDRSRPGFTFARSLPPMARVPVCGCRIPASRYSSVVLPLPLGPASATRSPGWTEKLSGESAGTSE